MSQIAIWRTLPVEPFGYWHHGVLCPDKSVIHFKSRSSLIGKRDARIVHTSFRAFMGSSTPTDTPVYRIIHRKQLPPEEVVRRARSCLGERGYNLFRNNCETFASWAVTGHRRSYQIESLRSALRLAYRNGNVAGAMCAVADVVADMPVPCPSMVPLKHRGVKSRRSQTSKQVDSSTRRLSSLSKQLDPPSKLHASPSKLQSSSFNLMNLSAKRLSSSNLLSPSSKRLSSSSNLLSPSSKRLSSSSNLLSPSSKRLNMSSKRLSSSTKILNPSQKRPTLSSKRLNLSSKRPDSSSKRVDSSFKRPQSSTKRLDLSPKRIANLSRHRV